MAVVTSDLKQATINIDHSSTRPKLAADTAGVIANEITLGENEPIIGQKKSKLLLKVEYYENQVDGYLKHRMGMYAPDASSIMWILVGGVVSLVVFSVALSIRHQLDPETKDYSFYIEEDKKHTLTMENIQLHGGVAYIWTPAHDNMIQTTILEDFNTGWTAIHADNYDICFVRRLNETNMPSLSTLQEVLDKRRLFEKSDPVLNKNWLMRALTEEELLSLGPAINWKCTGRHHIPTYYVEQFIPNGIFTSGASLQDCFKPCFPQFGLLPQGPAAELHFNMIAIDCITRGLCIKQP